MIRRTLYLSLIILVVVLTSHVSRATELLEDGRLIIPDEVQGKMAIDGDLEEAVWKKPPLKKEFVTIIPTTGQPLGLDTWVWAAYDKGNLYFAFKCFDPEAGKIKTSIAQRDKILSDDYVSILLDTTGNRQSSYEFYINPNGIQTDALGSAVSGSDITPDFVWDSAGKVTAEGYQCEVRIPLQSIRYQKGKNNEVKMRVMFTRFVPHLGRAATWPELAAGQTEYNFMADLVYKELKSALKLEVLPNFTYSWDTERVDEDNWENTTDPNIGVGIKYGISSAMTLEGTVNPDFSQVESDAFQMEVNRRYPVFFSEKRPFFMESKDVLDFTVIHQSMMINPIHTRFIVDPSWALKFSGSAGKMNFSMLAADDRSPGRAWDSGINPDEGESALFGILRAKYNLGSDNSLGILYSGRHFAGQVNNVIGTDLKYRLSKELRASLSYLHTSTRQAEGEPAAIGGGLNAMLQYNSPRLITWAIYERYDNDFFMATAFLNRSSISRAAGGVGPIFNIKSKKLPWLKRVIPFTHYYRISDLATNMIDTSWEVAVNLGFSPQGELNLEYWQDEEAWAGIPMNKKYFHSIGYIQLFKWLYLYEDITSGEQIYYHPSDPFVGDGQTITLGVTLEPGIKLKFGFDYLHAELKEKQTKQEIYSLDIYNLNTTYQFNKYFFLRGILRYNSYQEKWLTDFLASFTLIPGTVVHLGYGSLYLRNQWMNDQWIPGLGDVMMMKQGFFFKASYLWRIK